MATRQARRTEQPEDAGGKPSIDMGPLRHAIGYHMRRAQIAIFQDMIKAFAADDIRPAQYSVMALIATNPGLSQSEIAAALGIKRANFVSLIDGLEARGLARRASTIVDRRSHALFLTEAGSALLDKLHGLQREHEARIVERVGPENASQLLRLLKQIATMVGEDATEE